MNALVNWTGIGLITANFNGDLFALHFHLFLGILGTVGQWVVASWLQSHVLCLFWYIWLESNIERRLKIVIWHFSWNSNNSY